MHQSDSASKQLAKLSSRKALDFDYSVLDTETRVFVHKHTSEIKIRLRRNAQDTIDIGQKLIELKQRLGHGRFITWLKSEFNWSISAATKFMQVGEQFKFVKFTNLNITASALYVIAAPSTSKKARLEVLERASFGENITYTKAKEIVGQHKKTAKSKFNKPVTIDVSAKTMKCEYSKSIERLECKASAVLCATEVLTEKELETETRLLSFQDFMPSSAPINMQMATIIKINQDIPDDFKPIPANILNQADSDHMSDTVTNEMVIGIQKLTPEQLAWVIKKSANNGLSNYHLKTIITTSQEVLNQRHY